MYLKYNGKEYLCTPNCEIFTFTKIFPPVYAGIFSATLYNKANPSEKANITFERFDINSATLNN